MLSDSALDFCFGENSVEYTCGRVSYASVKDGQSLNECRPTRVSGSSLRTGQMRLRRLSRSGGAQSTLDGECHRPLAQGRLVNSALTGEQPDSMVAIIRLVTVECRRSCSNLEATLRAQRSPTPATCLATLPELCPLERSTGFGAPRRPSPAQLPQECGARRPILVLARRSRPRTRDRRASRDDQRRR